MLATKPLQGTGVALVTPFNQKLEPDLNALENLVHYILKNQVDFLVVLGTTSEASTLSVKEKTEVLKTVIGANAGQVPLIMGLGGNDTRLMADTINKTNFDGIDGILSVAPFYNKPSQAGLYLHFKEMALASPVPIVLYNVPGRTACNIEADTTLQLARDFNNIIAVKEASGDFDQAMQIIQNKPPGFTVLSGEDANTLPFMAAGGDGVISVIANAFPFEFSQMVREVMNGALPEARRLHYQILDLIRLIFSEGNPAGIKALLNIKGLINNTLRLPLTAVSDTTYCAIEKALNKN